MGVKKINGGVEDFINKFVRARGGDSTGLDASRSSASATGGTKVLYNGKTIHLFIASGIFSTGGGFNSSVNWVITAGGGGGSTSDGGGTAGGGGGAGGYRTGTTPVGGGLSFNVTIGDGGASGDEDVNAGNGDPSSIAFPGGTESSTGGGRGGKYNQYVGAAGGSGGGGVYGENAGGAGDAGGYTPVEGYPGGDGQDPGAQDGGGGGGAGGAGEGPGLQHGGIGVQLPSEFRSPTIAPTFAPGPGGQGFWLAGGGGSGNSSDNEGKGGGPGGPYAGGGDGASAAAADDAKVNTGGGGGGVGYGDTYDAGDGGKGVVLIIY